MFNLENGIIAVVETVWALAQNSPFAIDARLEVIGTEGTIVIDNTGSNFSIIKKDGYQCPQSTYWPKVHGMRRGFLKEELDYFLKCIESGTTPTIITPEESMRVIDAFEKAEESAKTNKVVFF